PFTLHGPGPASPKPLPDHDGGGPPTPPIPPPDFTSFLSAPGSLGQLATLTGPQAVGAQKWLPEGQPLPYTVQFANPPGASSAVGQVRIVQTLDPTLDQRTFRLGDLKLGDLQVHIPAGRATFRGDFDLTRSKGFILRVFAGLEVQSGVATWLVQAIDPATGEVVTDPGVGLLLPSDVQGHGSGMVSYTIQPRAGLASGTPIKAQARVLFNTAAPQDTNEVMDTIDGQAPVTTLTATLLTPGGSAYQVQWSAQD